MIELAFIYEIVFEIIDLIILTDGINQVGENRNIEMRFLSAEADALLQRGRLLLNSHWWNCFTAYPGNYTRFCH